MNKNIFLILNLFSYIYIKCLFLFFTTYFLFSCSFKDTTAPVRIEESLIIKELQIHINNKDYEVKFDNFVSTVEVVSNAKISEALVKKLELAENSTASIRLNGIITFTNSVGRITVIARNKATQSYTIYLKIVKPKNNDKTISNLELRIKNEILGVIFSNFQAYINVVSKVPITQATINKILLPLGATSSVNINEVLNFENNIAVITITAEDNSKQNYQINLSIIDLQSDDKNIILLKIDIDGKTYTVTFTNFESTINIKSTAPISQAVINTITVSDMAGTTVQNNGTLHFYNNIATITVIAQDGTRQDFIIKLNYIQ